MPKPNLFKDRSLAKATIMDCSISKYDLVYEIEPQDELITAELTLAARKVIAFLKPSKELQENLSKLQQFGNLEVREVDFLKYEIQDPAYKVFSNITASASSEIIRRILFSKKVPLDTFFISTEEVANRYCGLPKENEASVLGKPWFDISILKKYLRRDFKPEPTTDIVLFTLKRRKRAIVSPENANVYRNFIKFSFDSGKKGLDSAYTNIFSEEQWKKITKDLEIKLSTKPDELSFPQWMRLFEHFLKVIPESKRMPVLKKKGK